MFQGIIEVVGRIVSIKRAGSVRLQVNAGRFAPKLKPGDSIALDGICLTVVGKSGKNIAIDVSPETLSRTNLKGRSTGDAVNLELPITGSTMISGHFVQGHIEGTGRVSGWKRRGSDVRLRVDVPGPLREFCIPKGSIALNGVSLTIASMKGNHIEVALIPYTLRHTNLAALEMGDPVNIESDMIGRYVVSVLKNTYDKGRKRRGSAREA